MSDKVSNVQATVVIEILTGEAVISVNGGWAQSVRSGDTIQFTDGAGRELGA